MPTATSYSQLLEKLKERLEYIRDWGGGDESPAAASLMLDEIEDFLCSEKEHE